LIVFLSACNLKISHDQDKYSSARTDTVQIKSQADSLEELSKLYTRAIRDFLRASENEYRLHFDTLYIGKHVYGQPDDFPDIDLPAMIDSTIIRIIAPEDGIRIQRFSGAFYCKTSYEGVKSYKRSHSACIYICTILYLDIIILISQGHPQPVISTRGNIAYRYRKKCFPTLP